MGILDRFSLAGKVALVTGGAGLYGRQIVLALAEAGARTFMAARNLTALEAQAAQWREQGIEVTPLQFDQANEPSIYALRDTILAQAGQIDILVNNAVARPMQQGYESDLDTFAESMAVNATGLFAITRAFGDAMAERGSGSIINIGSIYGFVGPDPTNYRGTDMAYWAPDYCFHKGGMANYTRFLGSYYGRNGVRCNCVNPGGFQTPNHPEAFLRQYGDHTFLGRMANDTDLMGAIVFLASDASAYITGENLMVDGGYTQK